MKIITLKDEVYKELLKLKGNKSFSETISELIKNKRLESIKNLKGIAKDSKFFEEIEKEILEERKKIKVRI